MNRADLSAALCQAELVHDRTAIERAILRMGEEISTALVNQATPIFLTVMNGGLVFAGTLALGIKTDIEFDYLHATRYRGSTAGGELHWLSKPKLALGGRLIILVDDILDEGHTLKAVRDYCTNQGAARVLVAVLCEKEHGRCVAGIKADFVGLKVPDKYVFGYGMDYYEQGRNLPGIYAV